MRLPLIIAALAALLGVSPVPSAGSLRGAEGVEKLRVQVLAKVAHDRAAFTQGLEMVGGTLYEGTGGYGRGQSAVTAGPPGAAALRADLPGPWFGEGITVVNSHLWQLTWKDGIAVERDAASLAPIRQVRYTGEGWGLCHQSGKLVMSDGSARLTLRDPDTFAITGTLDVTEQGKPVTGLNELECGAGTVLANVYGTDRIVHIDAATGHVSAVIDASGLLTPAERPRTDVLNGIAAIPGTNEFWLTGKLWPAMFRVRLVPAD
jgi:glutaminyl-peptide cyclotransferase